MPLSAVEILNLIKMLPKPGATGRADYAARRHRNRAIPVETSALDALRESLIVEPYPRTEHPEKRALARGGAKKRGEPITAIQAAWFAALPTTPADVSFDDAQELYRLASQADPRNADGRIIGATWARVKHHWDLIEAREEVAAIKARAPKPIAPAVHAALIRAIQDETGIAASEATARAQDLINNAVLQRDERYAHELAKAQARLAALEATDLSTLGAATTA